MAPESPIEILDRWEGAGATWKPVHVSDALAIVDLCTCYGEPVDRLEASDPATIAYVRKRLTPQPAP